MSVYVEPGCCGGGVQKVLPDNEFNKLDESNQKLVKSADQDDPESCYNLGKNLIEGQYGFPVMLNLGENYLLKSVKQKHVESLIYYSQLLQDGDRIPKNEKKAKGYLETAAKKGSSVARVRLGQLYLDSNEVKKGIKELQKGVKQNNSEAMVYLSKLYQEGNGVKQNNEEAVKLLKQAATNGYPAGVNAYAEALRKGTICKANLREAANLYKTNADNGNKDAALTYAQMLENGEGIEKSLEEAAKYYKVSADRGNIDAQYYYAHMLLDGRGVEKDEQEGSKYLKQAVDNEHPEALYEWAVKAFYGHGIEKDAVYAEELSKKSAVKGSVNGSYFYGIILQNQEQYGQASSYFLTASNKGHKNATMELAFMRLYGRGCNINFQEAHDLFKKYNIDSCAKIGLGIMTENGYLVKRDYQAALELYRSLKGTPREPDGIAYEACMILSGKGFKSPDEKKAIEMFQTSMTSTQVLDPETNVGNESTLGTAYYYYLTIKKNAEEGIQKLTELSYQRHDMHARELLASLYLTGTGCKKNVEQAVNLYKLSAGQGNHTALYKLGMMYLTGENVGGIDNVEAVSCFKKSAKLNNVEAHAKYAECLLNGIGLECRNERKALKHSRIAAEEGNVDGMAIYGSMLYYGKGCQSDYNEAKPFIVKASDAKIPEAMDVLGLMYLRGQGFDVDMKKAADLFKKASELDHVDATYHYAKALENGEGVKEDIKAAATFYKKAADAGHVESMYIFGLFSETGKGTGKSDKEAAKYYEQAANKDHVEAMSKYAILLHEGRGVKKDLKEALNWNKKAADLGNTTAMNNYAEQLINGEGCFKNKKGAIPYLEKSEAKGDAHGIFIFGRCYENGDGVEANMYTAAQKYSTAAEKGDLDAIYKTAEILIEGKYLPKNPTKAFEYYEILANNGDVPCCIKLGQHYEEEGNLEKALNFFKTASDKEDPMGMFCYGKMCLEGKGREKDTATGVKLIENAANHDNPQALTKYGTILIMGAFDVKKNEKKGFKMVKQAADLGEKDAFHYMATSYEHGKGTKVDLKKAAEFYEKSYKSGNQFAEDDENNCYRVQREIEASKSK